MDSPPDPVRLEERCRRLENQITTMKQISSLRKNLLELRERQAKALIEKLKSYEVIVTGERECRHNLSSRLQIAELLCEQLTQKLTQNAHSIEEMKTNYETKVSTLINELQTSEQRNQQLSEELSKECSIEELAKRLDDKDKLIKDMQRQIKKVWDRNKVLAYQMSLLNNLFNETEGVTIDFEKIKAIGDIVRESQSLAGDEDDTLSDDQDEESRQSTDLENLLDSMEKSEDIIPEEIPGEESCYKSVDTKRGPQLVLSVSRTFIKLKDLIVEKKSLQKEIDTLKALNIKLESKVDKQEHRLYRVTMEVNKTWSLVSKLKQQHKRLYNSEAVLRYELQEKRVLLEKLKTELSISRDKWRRVRQKNTQSQIEWEKLRDEFAERKHQSSQESGTFSEVMSVSSSEGNDATVEEDEPDVVGAVAQEDTNNRRRGSKAERSRTLSLSSETQAESTSTEIQPEVEEGECPVEDEYEGAHAVSPIEDETFDDPLEELVSKLVEDIDNEADTEEDSTHGQCSKAVVEIDSSPSPDFEDRMRRRANRLRMLEEQCVMLHQKLRASTDRSETLSTKLAELHDHYGPSDSTTETPSDEHPKQHQDEHASSTEKEEAESSNTRVSTTVTDEETTSISTDAAYVSGAENNSGKDDDETKPEFNTQQTREDNKTLDYSIPCQESSTSRDRELINSSENNVGETRETTTKTKSTTPSNIINQNEEQAVQSSSQGQLEDNDGGKNARFSSITTTERNSTTRNVCPNESTMECEQSTSKMNISSTTTSLQTASIKLPHEQPSTSQSQKSNSDNESRPLSSENTTEQSTLCTAECDSKEMIEQQDSSSSQEQQLPNIGTGPAPDVSQPQVAEVLPSEEEEPLPIIQETVVQHFPNTTEEEANELAPVQIRPEFLRILQEADEATNANSLDWMPSLLTITHSVALLRLDPPELPSATSSSGGMDDSANNSSTNANRSLSESLRIEIPRQSPSPPINPTRRNQNRRNHNNDDNDSTTEVEGDEENIENLAVLRKDPSFLSRMIIKQLPKRLQLLKNENHTLQMETVEAKMRMKEMKRQLSKELEKQHEFAVNLDAQIEDKNLIEFELREELEKKEKVIEELQMEIDESKDYIDEIKKEKDELDAYFKVLIEEKADMEQPIVALESVQNCHNCKRSFSFLTRRKCHCKICGNVFCKDCAIEREPNKRSSKRPRLCTRCHLRRQRLVALVNAQKNPLPQQSN